MRKPRKRAQAPVDRPRGHRQRPPDCCLTYEACYGRDHACVDCEVLELADSRLGMAILLGWSPRGGGGLADTGPGVSVLDALIQAEELFASIPKYTCRRAG